MNTFIEMLPLELREVTDYIEPNTEFGSNDYDVGVMSEDLKKLYTLWTCTMKSAAHMKADSMFGRVDNKEECDARLDELVERVELLARLFWFTVKAEHNLWGKNSVGVRKGFTVVWSDQTYGETFLHKLFEGL